MALQFSIAVFDVDGTILDTSEGIISSIVYTINKYGLRSLNETELRSFIGPPVQDSFGRYYQVDERTKNELASTFRNQYKNHDLLKAKPYDGIYDLFGNMVNRGIIPAIATYKRKDYAIELLKYFKFDQYTDSICGSDFDGKMKKKDIISSVLNSSGMNMCSKAVVIGDSDNDAMAASQLGIRFIGVTYGFGFESKEDVEKFKHIGVSSSVSEIKELLLGDYS